MLRQREEGGAQTSESRSSAAQASRFNAVARHRPHVSSDKPNKSDIPEFRRCSVKNMNL